MGVPEEMRICYLADANSLHLQRWVRYFTENGHYVHLVWFEPFDSNIKETNLLSLHSLRRILPHIGIVSDIANGLFASWQVRMLLRKINPDILHVHYVADHGVIGALANFHPFIVSVWGSDVLVAPKESWMSKYKVSFILRRADCITTTAELMKGHLVKTFALPQNKIVRVPWGIDLQVFHRGYEAEVRKLRRALGIRPGVPVILSNRRTVPQYRIEKIVNSIPSVLKLHPDAVFIFIKGWDSSDFENKMKLESDKLGVADNTRFISRIITPVEMAIFLNAADAFISIPKTDQFGGSVMEGMVCGAVPIVSDIEVYHQYLRDDVNALFVNAANPREIAEKIIYVIEHLEIKDDFYAINKKIIEEKEDWEKNSKKMRDLYEHLLESDKLCE